MSGTSTARASRRPAGVAWLVIGLIVGASFLTAEADAFEWTGRLQRDLKDLRSVDARTRTRAVERLTSYDSKQIRPHVLRALEDIEPSVQRAAARIVADRHFTRAVPILVRWLSHWDDQMRITAAKTLGQLGGKRAVRTLVRALVDPEHTVRLRVVEALGNIADRSTVVPLIARTDDSNTAVRQAAVEVLAKLKDRRAVIPLMARLNDPARSVRAAAVRALGALDDRHAAAAMNRLLRDPSPQVVAAVIETLGKMRYAKAAEPLVDLMQTSSHPKVRRLAALALAQIGSGRGIRALVAALHRQRLSNIAALALQRAGKPAVPHIRRLLSDPRTPRAVAMLAVDVARRARIAAALPELVAQLRRGRLPRTRIIQALGQIGDSRAQRPLLALLEGSGSEIRLAALRALSGVVDRRAAEPLLRCLDDTDPAIRRLAMRHLGRLGSRVATPALSRIALSKDRDAARRAAAALTRIPDERSAKTFVALLARRDRELRRSAVQGLSQLRPTELADEVLALCKRSSISIRGSCIQALGGILRDSTHAAARSFLLRMFRTNDHTTLLSTIDALAAMGDAAVVPALLERIEHLEPPLARRVIEILGRFPSASTKIVERLRQLLAAEPASIRGAAAWAAAMLSAEQLRPELARAVRTPGWASRINATAALAAVGSRQARALLRGLLRDRDPYVRSNAALGLGRSGDATAVRSLGSRVAHDRSPWVRLNALRALLLIRPDRYPLGPGKSFKSSAKLVKAVASNDPDQRVRRIARTLLGGDHGTARGDASTRDWLGLYLLDHQHQPLRRTPIVLIRPDGLIKATYSDVRAQHWAEDLPPGRCYVELAPSELARPGPKR